MNKKFCIILNLEGKDEMFYKGLAKSEAQVMLNKIKALGAQAYICLTNSFYALNNKSYFFIMSYDGEILGEVNLSFSKAKVRLVYYKTQGYSARICELIEPMELIVKETCHAAS